MVVKCESTGCKFVKKGVCTAKEIRLYDDADYRTVVEKMRCDTAKAKNGRGYIGGVTRKGKETYSKLFGE